MAAVGLDRQAIERRDFPIGRRGYDPAAVDAHLRELATQFEALQRGGTSAEQPSLAVSAGMQVQGIIAAAEKASAEIERDAREQLQRTRDEALLDAARLREDAIAQGRTLVAAVTQATSVLLERVGSMDGELASLVDSLRAGATRLTGDLAAVKGNMGELYDAASSRTGTLIPGASAPEARARELAPSAASEPSELSGDSPPEPDAKTRSAPITGAGASSPGATEAKPALNVSESVATSTAAQATLTMAADEPVAAPQPTAPEGDVDGARLIALNMALNGDSRADAERYLAENFKLIDRAKLIEEVYAAIEA
jgi:DivIVA domain-containing protein